MFGQHIYSCIWVGFVLVFKVHIADSLECYKCDIQQPCTGSDILQGLASYGREKCFDEEVCAKDVLYERERSPKDDTYIRKTEYVRRGCVKFDPTRDVLNRCFHKLANHLREEVRCLCNDTNYCNKGPTIHPSHTRIAGLMAPVVGLGLITTTLMVFCL